MLLDAASRWTQSKKDDRGIQQLPHWKAGFGDPSNFSEKKARKSRTTRHYIDKAGKKRFVGTSALKKSQNLEIIFKGILEGFL